MGLTIHHLSHSQSTRVLWLCEELHLTYTLKKYLRDPFLSPPELKALHPLGASPIIEDHDADDVNVKLAETEAIVNYISEIHGEGKFIVRPGEGNYAEFLYWFHITNGTLQPGIGRILALDLAGVDEKNEIRMRYLQKVHQVLEFMDGRLGDVPWLAGEEITAADIMVIFSLTGMREFCPIDLSEYKNLLGYMRKVVERPAFRAAMRKGDPDIDIEEFIQGPPPPSFMSRMKK